MFKKMLNSIAFLMHDLREKRNWDKDFNGKNPYRFDNDPYEEQKYKEQLELAARAGGKFGKILEIGCAEGYFTEKLASIADKVVGIDISQTACVRAKKRCSAYGNIEIRCGSIYAKDLDGPYDLVFASEVLYYLSKNHGYEQMKEACSKIANAIRPGGVLIMANWYHPENERSVLTERNIRGFFESAGMEVEHEEFKNREKQGNVNYYCLLMLRKKS